MKILLALSILAVLMALAVPFLIFLLFAGALFKILLLPFKLVGAVFRAAFGLLGAFVGLIGAIVGTVLGLVLGAIGLAIGLGTVGIILLVPLIPFLFLALGIWLLYRLARPRAPLAS